MSFVDRLFPKTRQQEGASLAAPGHPPVAPAVAPAAPAEYRAANAVPTPSDPSWQPAPYAMTQPTQAVPQPGAPAAPATSAPPLPPAPAQPMGTPNSNVPPAPPASVPAPARQGIDARRQALSRELAELQWDLGGLAYEMAIRDHFRLDVLAKRAARLQAVDAELAEVERQLRLDDAGASGECPSCRALHSRGAVFCWSCGAQLLPTQRAGEQPPGPVT